MDGSAALARFTRYPYRLLPDERVTIWAGYPEVKARLLRLIESARTDRVGLYQFSVLHGELGTGKSHAMRYLMWVITERDRDEYQSIAVYLPRVAVEAKTEFVGVYRAIMKQAAPQLREVASRLAEQLDAIAEERRTQAGQPAASRDRFFSDVVDEVGGNDAEILRALLNLDGPSYQAGVSRLVGGGRGDVITTDYEAVRTLGAIVRFATKGVGNSPSAAKAFYVFLDEIEAIADFSNAQAVSVNNGIRDTLNAAPEAFCLVLGLTGDAAYLEGLFDTNVIARLTSDPIELGPLDEEQAVAFLRELHSAYREPGAAVSDDYPFTEEGLREVIRKTPDKTPRSLLRSCRVALEEAVLQGVFEGSDPIDAAQIDELID